MRSSKSVSSAIGYVVDLVDGSKDYLIKAENEPDRALQILELLNATDALGRAYERAQKLHITLTRRDVSLLRIGK